jgi:CubicO group peptidase (beta-lactamase class C family)
VHGYRLQDGNWLEEPPLPDGAFGSMAACHLERRPQPMGRPDARCQPPRGAESKVLKRSSLREMQQVARFAGGSAARTAPSGTLTMTSGGYAYGLRVSQNCLFNHIVAHSGGLPGFGSQMRWLPEYGVGIVALGNLTYTSWGGVIDQAFDVLARSGGLTPRAPQPSPVLLAMQQQVTRLVQAVALLAMQRRDELFDDRPAQRRAVTKMRCGCGNRCAACGTSSVRATGVGITLAPRNRRGAQQLTVTPATRMPRRGRCRYAVHDR